MRTYSNVKSQKCYDPHLINLALEDLRDGKSIRKVAEKHGISRSVLHRCLKNGVSEKKRGGQTVFSEEQEKLIVGRLQICSDWGYPIDPITMRLIIKDFIDRQGQKISKFKDNMPGPDFVIGFVKRHSRELSARMCQNIKRSRAAVSRQIVDSYFDNLESELKDVPSANIVNYDETNLCDDPGRRKIISRRGCKYPERVMNSTKASISVMFAAAGDGKILPPYVVYKAQNMYGSWRVGGPPQSWYNRTKSGWFDSTCFEDWVQTVALPYLRKLEGTKILIGDNLASHISMEVISQCSEHNIRFIFLPANSTHLTQPLDVAFFRPLKQSWRTILENWKKGPGRNEASLPKDKFPPLLKDLCSTLKESNVIAGFKKCGIIPLNRNSVLNMLPSPTTMSEEETQQSTAAEALDSSFKGYLEEIRRQDVPQQRKKRTKVSVLPGKSVSVADVDAVEAGPSGISTGPQGPANEKKKKKKRPSKDAESTTEDESDYSLQESDNQGWNETLSDQDDPVEASVEDRSETSPLKLSLWDFVIVKVLGKKPTNFRLYVAKVVEFDEDGYIWKFYRKSSHGLKFSETTEEALFKVEDIILKINQETKKTTSNRLKDFVTFENDLSDYTLH